MTTLGQRLKECRKQSGYRQSEVCTRTGIKQGTLSELENDKYPTSSFVPQLAQLYGVEALWLATGNGPRQKQQISKTAMKVAELISGLSDDQQAKILHYLEMSAEINRQARLVKPQLPSEDQPAPVALQGHHKS